MADPIRIQVYFKERQNKMGRSWAMTIVVIGIVADGCQDSGNDSWFDGDASVGPCSGTPAECEAARVINEYRMSHRQKGECNNALKWDDHIGQLAHDHQSGPFVRHSNHDYLENVGQSYGVRETALYIIQYEPGTEPHCHGDGSYQTSHHCAAMYCGNHTVGVGVYQQDGGATYMTMMFGDENGDPAR